MHEHVSAHIVLETRHAEPTHADDLTILAAARDRNLHQFVFEDAFDLDIGTKRCLDHRDDRGHMQIVAHTLEELVWVDAARNDQVARTCTANACFAIAAQTQLLSIVNAHRDID